ncbi:hypothetical protein LNP74_15340 [Klebsiella pneumoniae subsp. pneumoniae]|nr:hypothetical protein [Klebsiella pneumoniae subsp. pneumoniae]
MGSWVDTPAGQPVNFGGLMTPRERFAYLGDGARGSAARRWWRSARHTWASHYGLPANPQGSREACRRQPRPGINHRPL